MHRVRLLEQVERENSELREDLKEREAALLKFENNAGVSWEDYQHLLEKFQNLEKSHKYTKVQGAQYKGAVEVWRQRYETAKERYDKSKEEIRKWKKYADLTEEKQASKELAGLLVTPSINDTVTPDLQLPTPRTVSSSSVRVLSRLRLQSDGRASASPPSNDIGRTGALAGAISDCRSPDVARQPSMLRDEVVSSPIRTHSDTPLEATEIAARQNTTVVHLRPESSKRALPNSEQPNSSLQKDLQAGGIASRHSPQSSATVVPQEFYHEELVTLPDRDQPAPTVEQQVQFVPPSLQSTQSTEGETVRERSTPPAETHYHLQGDDEEPEVVSTRILRPNVVRRKLAKSAQNVDVTPQIKHETSRGGLSYASVRRLQPDQSIEDLDRIPGIVLTPRKYRQLQRLRSSSQGPINYAGRPPSLPQMRSSSVPVDVSPDQVLRGSFQQELRSSAPAVEGLQAGNDPAGLILIDHDDDDSDMPDSPSTKAHPHILRPISSNARLALPRTSEQIPNRKRKYDQTLAAKLDDLAEDGGLRHTRNRDEALQQMSPLTKTPRIQNMLEAPSVKKSPIVGTPVGRRPRTSASTPVTVVRADRMPVAQVRGTTTDDTAKKPVSVGTPRQKQVYKSSAPVTAVRTSRPPVLEIKDTYGDEEYDTRLEDEPLRLRPVGNLTLNDFKINPQYNGGLDYAFSEVIRNRDERKCLPGCTRPDCCGNSFRKVIEIGGALAGPKQSLWDNDDDLEADQRLLEQFLGTDAQNRLRRMTTEQKKEMLMEAHVERLAQKHGRHKAAFARRVTPPGFWDADFPSSQEQEKYRRKAEQMEREKVEERYQEAMRTGGRWMFRDE